MKTVRIVFYIIYIPTIIIVLLIAMNLYPALDLFKEWGWYKSIADIPVMGTKLLYFLCALMAIELLIENLFLSKTKSKVDKSKATIKELEDKLYDRAQQEVTKDGFVELDLDEISG